MLRSELVKLANSGHLWAFVGSGVSVDSGGPKWEHLVERVLLRLDPDLRQKLEGDPRFQHATSNKEYPTCFGEIERFAGREALELGIKDGLESLSPRGELVRLLADWPFAGYVTTNYDGLLEAALRQARARAWISVGNTADEIRKVSGDATGVVWHVHGSILLPADKSKLILTERDYDDVYLEGSPLMNQLRALLTQRRVVFIGFGFQDAEVTRLLKAVGRMSSPARPAYAFFSGIGGRSHELDRSNLFDRYNVDVIPYQTRDSSHIELIELLKTYSSFVLRRSLRFGQQARPVPSYDPETTGLLVYNQLVLQQRAQVGETVVACLVRSRILSLLRYQGPSTVRRLGEDLGERIRLIRGVPADGQGALETVRQQCDQLIADGLVRQPPVVTEESVVSLAESGTEMLDGFAAVSQRLFEQFSASVKNRAQELLPGQAQPADRVARVVETFLLEAVRTRALGVAMVWHSPTADFQRFHMVGLLQALPNFLSQLEGNSEGQAAVALVQEILARPTEAEARYLGLVLQAHFGISLLGYDHTLVEVRTRELQSTLFLLDATTIIPALARSSRGCASTRLMLDRMRAIGSGIATTRLLATEAAEHARWAVGYLAAEGGLSGRALVAMVGVAGHETNLFLEGYAQEFNLGLASSFEAYLDSICGSPEGRRATDGAFVKAVQKTGIACLTLDEWDGFAPELQADRDSLQSEIAQARMQRGSYKHERQVLAEAEALVIVRSIRAHRLKLFGRELNDACFVSPTRVIDEVAGPGLPITIRPQAVLHWLSTVTPCSADELASIVDGLICELAERDLSIVDQNLIQTSFPHLIVASRERLQEEIEAHRAFVAERYGEGAEKAFEELTDVYVPIAAESYYRQKAEYLEEQLRSTREVSARLADTTKVSAEERRELAVLRERERQRKMKAGSRKRASASRPKGKKRKKKKRRR